MTVRTQALRPAMRRRLLLGASATALIVTASAADGQNMFRKLRGGNPAEQAAAAAAQRATQNQAASTATRRTIEAFQRASAVRQRMDAAQVAARAAAMAAQVSVPNGLGKGGLQVANGVATDPSLWIGADGPTQATGGDGRTKVEVGQTQDKAILTWDSFNVGRETDLAFNQKGNTNWVALNRVTDASADPSRILGSIKAEGTVLILNRNGVIFGGASQVNTRNLVAAAAAITDDQFMTRGIYSQLDGGQYLPSFTDAAGVIKIEAGAQITTVAPKTVLEGGGYVMLLGVGVENAGSITTAKGQTLLAAGDDFLVRQGTGSEGGGGFTRGNEVRGLIDEDSVSGTVLNTGSITTARGDITLTGRDVVQDGVLLTTTSVNAVGTIHLSTSASDMHGLVTLTGKSLTTILPELDSDETALDSQRDALEAGGLSGGIRAAQFDNVGFGAGSKSQVDIVSGGDVLFASGSTTLAQGGNVYTSAGGRIQTEADAIIDVSGVRGVALDIGSNAILVNVQGNELRDSPVNRDQPFLKNQDVWIDTRDLILLPAGVGGYATDRYYTPGGLLEIGGYLANTAHGIGEWSAVGGTIAFNASEIVADRGSIFNISGGSLDYAAGSVRRTRLQGIDGRLYDIGEAPAGMEFVSVGRSSTVEHARWGAQYREVYSNPLFNRGVYARTEDGYTAGRDAGQLLLSSPTTLFEGQIVADIVTGSRQTTTRPSLVTDGYKLPQDVSALAGSLVLADFGGPTILQTGADTDVRFTDLAVASGPGTGESIDADRIGTSWFADDGATRDLEALLIGKSLGVPPRRMRQPMRLAVTVEPAPSATTAGGSL